MTSDDKSSDCGDSEVEKEKEKEKEEEEYAGNKDYTQKNMVGAAIATLPGITTVCEPYPAEQKAAIRIQTAFRGFLV